MAATQLCNVIMAIAFTATVTAAGMKDICQWETFEAKCQKDEVILMKKANYGRMRLGRCQPRNYFVGCSADVTDIMHIRCSGRQHCSVPVPDPTMFAATPCPKDLVTYLEADYDCVKVAKHNSANCDQQALTGLSGYISKPPTKITDLKTVCPHRILAQPGQIIKLYLYDFYNNEAARNMASHECLTYGSVSEDSTTAPVKICGGALKTNQHIYSSKTNIIDITLVMGSAHAHHYMLRYKVEGLPIADSIAAASETGFFIVVCVGLTFGLLFGAGILTLVIHYVRARRSENQQTVNAAATSHLEKPIEFRTEQSSDKAREADQYQPLYASVGADRRGEDADVTHVYEMPRPSDLSTLYAPRVDTHGDYCTLSTRRPVTENTYGMLGGECAHSIYNITSLD